MVPTLTRFSKMRTVPTLTWFSGINWLLHPHDSYEWERSLRGREPDWLDPPPHRFPTLPSLLSRLSRSLLWRLPLASNSNSLTSLHNRSTTWSLSSNFPCPEVFDIVQRVWYNPAPRPDCSSFRSRSLSSRLLCLHSLHVDPQEDPTDPLSAWPPECPSNIFRCVSLYRTMTL